MTIQEAAERLRDAHGHAGYFHTVGVGIGLGGASTICVYLHPTREIPGDLAGIAYLGFPLEVVSLGSPLVRRPSGGWPALGDRDPNRGSGS